MSENNDFATYNKFINEEFCIFRKSDEYFPIYLVARKGGDTYEVNIKYPQDSLNLKDIDVVIEKIASFRKVNPSSLYTEIQTEIIKLIHNRQTEQEK